jgi:2-C-methyl-D-erythritol 4-phosphate cytidylyltransferase/2-C-methyl-D-erythritol 2,4-cyclodiphosphate synthase
VRRSVSSGTPFDVIVVAAGAGLRMGGVDKALIPIAGKPALQWSLESFAATDGVRRIVVVTAQDRVANYAALPWIPAQVAAVVPGGATRSASVAAGLKALDRAPGEAADVLLIHDAARPGVDAEVTIRVVAAAMQHGAAAPVMPIADTLKRVAEKGSDDVATHSSGSVDRAGVVSAQTPQGIATRHIAAFTSAVAHQAAATDDSSILESIGVSVELVKGSARLRKLTEPDDLLSLGALLRPSDPTVPFSEIISALPGSRIRIGWGDDAHPVGVSGTLHLGGRAFPGSPALIGHSDGDVVLHAVADALIGAAGLGDLGRLFPATEETPKGIASGTLLTESVNRAAAVGVQPLWVDLLITASTPKLAPHLEEIGANVANLLGIPADRVSAKASTGNLVGDEGAGKAIRCAAILVAQRRGAQE